MTSCGDIRTKLSALLDNELSKDETTDVQNHLQTCEACRQQWQSLQSVDDQLKRLLTIDDIAENINRIEKLTQVQRAPHHSNPRRLLRWATIIAAVAATILFAFIASRPPRGVQPPAPIPTPRTPTPRIVAQLVRATGPVEVLSPNSHEWMIVSPGDDYAFAEGTRLKTGENVLCELRTFSEGKLRVDESAELILHDSRKVELLTGQLWCLAPKQSGIDVDIPIQDELASKIATMACPSTAEIQCVAGDSFAACDSLSTQNPPAEFALGAFKCPVAPGETVSIDAKQNVDRKIESDSGNKVWQLPLLAIGNQVDDELIASMSSLLAPIGMTKARHFNEQQIRELGPKGALPLLAYVQSGSAPQELRLRRTAIDIAADLADERAIGLLQQLKSDSDPYISRRAQEGLRKIAQQAN